MKSMGSLKSFVLVLMLAPAAHAQPSPRPTVAAPPAAAPPPAPPPAAAPPAAAPPPATAPAPAAAPPVAPAPVAPPSAPPSSYPSETQPGVPPPAQAPGPMPTQPPISAGSPPGAVGVGSVYSEPVPVWLLTEDGETPVVEIYPEWANPGSVPALARCRLPCGFQMQRGRYRIEVLETEDTLGGSRAVSVDGPVRLVITPRDRAKKTTGLVLGIGGAIAVVTGIALLADGASHVPAVCDSSGSCTRDWNTEMSTGGLVALAGAIMTPIGWVMFGKSLRPAIDVEHVGAASRRPVRQIGIIGLPGGAGLGGTFTF
jgi:hypothetical protein